MGDQDQGSADHAATTLDRPVFDLEELKASSGRSPAPPPSSVAVPLGRPRVSRGSSGSQSPVSSSGIDFALKAAFFVVLLLFVGVLLFVVSLVLVS